MFKARRSITIAAMGALLFTSGCVATRSQLRRGLEEQRAALEAERAERMAADQEAQQESARLAGNIETLRTDLAALDQDFGVKIAQLEEGMQLAVPVHFAFDESEVGENSHQLLDRFVALVQRHYPTSTITIEGFADPAGSAEYNRRLAQRRADSVREELIVRGLPETQLRAVGYGEERLVVPNAAGSAFGADLNRRVAFVIETAGPTALAPSATQD
jgi:peptidoglycan-associated lipoprotein